MSAQDSTFMQDPKTMTDEQIDGWIANFRSNPPTLDYMGEYSWAQRVAKEFQARAEAKAAS